MKQEEPSGCLDNLPCATMHIRDKGRTNYIELWQRMKEWTEKRDALSEDECWLTHHPAIFTFGQRAKMEHLLANPTAIPVVHSDRGGQITYHGPGQLIFYLLLDLRRRRIGVKTLVWAVEESVIRLLAKMNIVGHRRRRMPGVYVNRAKIAAMGFRIHKGRCYHGMSFNHQTELSVFEWLNPCGYADLTVTSLVNEGIVTSAWQVQLGFLQELAQTLCYNIEPREVYEYGERKSN